MPSRKSASYKMLRDFQRDVERVQDWHQRLVESVMGNDLPGKVFSWGTGLDGAKHIEHLVKWLKNDAREENVPLPSPKRAKKNTRPATPG